ncbi:MAG: hypothetical protein CME26_12690 [Gemmatimonadetes bacterium]|nr:hypothetical protein [Gemmatimonadota bacterium]
MPGVLDVRLVIYNVLGQEVRSLIDDSQPAGRYSPVWDGRDAIGRGVSNGI